MPRGLIAKVCGAATLWAAACVYDADRRCDTNQTEIEDDRCVCQEGFIPQAGGCVPCGEHEIARGDTCVCAPGYGLGADARSCEACAQGEVQVDGVCACEPGAERDPSTQLCTQSGLGATCSADADCNDAAYPICHIEGASGYCTRQGCAAADDCGGAFACDTSTAPSYCRRPPLGQGATCSSNADCAGTQATYCDTFSSNLCLVEGCTPGGSDCFIGWSCCDLSSLGLDRQLCVTDGSCPAP